MGRGIPDDVVIIRYDAVQQRRDRSTVGLEIVTDICFSRLD